MNMKRKQFAANIEKKDKVLQVKLTITQYEALQAINTENYCISGFVNNIIMQYVSDYANIKLNDSHVDKSTQPQS